MRLRQRGTSDALSPWADDWVNGRERKLLGDQDAAALAFERRHAEQRHRTSVGIDFDTDVTDERPTAPHRGDETAREVMAWRAAVLRGLALPFRAI